MAFLGSAPDYHCFSFDKFFNFFCSSTGTETELSSEADMLRDQAKVIAITGANSNPRAIETIADPDRIVRLDLVEITDKVVDVICQTEEFTASKFILRRSSWSRARYCPDLIHAACPLLLV